MWRKIKKLPLYEINESTEAAKNMGVSGPPVFSVIKKSTKCKGFNRITEYYQE